MPATHNRLSRPGTATSPGVRWLLAGLLCAGWLALYLATLTRVHTFDALSYALDVDNKPWRELFHPHHLAYGPLGVLVRNLAQTLGWQGSAVLPMQLANALAGALGVGLFFGCLHDATRRFDLALCGALLLGGSYAYWYYAVEVEVYTIAALFLVLCLWCLLRLARRPTLWLAAALGLVQGLAVLFHQTNVLLCVPAAAALLVGTVDHPPATAHRLPLWRRMVGRVVGLRGLLLAYGLPLVLVVAGSYALVGFGLSQFASLHEFRAWFTAYAHTGWWGSMAGSKWAELGHALTILLAQPAGAPFLLLLLGCLVLFGRRLVQTYRPLVLCLLLWLLTYGAFFFWWEPDNIEFWIAILPPALLLLVLALHTGGPAWHPGVLLVLAAGVAMGGMNASAVSKRGAGDYTPQYQIARMLGGYSQPGDLLLVPDGLQALYMQYYEGRSKALSLNQLLQTSQGDWDVACRQVRQRIEATLHSGGAVLIGDGFLNPVALQTPYGDPLLQRFDLAEAQVTACFAPYFVPYSDGFQPVERIDLGANLPTYYRLPTAQELLEGPGWEFSQSRWGWRVENVLAEYFDADGWGFFPTTDPHITSPRMQIDTSRYQGILVRLAKKVSNREGQLFFMDDSGIIEEERSIRWEMANHSQPKTYYLEVRDHPAWTGTLHGLRVDPTTGKDHDDGEHVQILWLRMVPVAEGG